jgi:hypothetical protein
VCGRCHEEELALFEQSPHSRAFRVRGLGQCVSCHGNHDIAAATTLLVGVTPDATCSKCHSRDDKPRKVASEIEALLRGARDRAAVARAVLARARREGLHADGAAFAADRVDTAELRLRPLVHSLDPARMEAGVAEVERAAVVVETLVAGAERERRVERRGYHAALGLSSLLFASLVLKARQLSGRRRRGAG